MFFNTRYINLKGKERAVFYGVFLFSFFRFVLFFACNYILFQANQINEKLFKVLSLFYQVNIYLKKTEDMHQGPTLNYTLGLLSKCLISCTAHYPHLP